MKGIKVYQRPNRPAQVTAFLEIWSLNSGTNWCSSYTASLKHRGLNCGNPTINISALNGISPCMRSANADGLWSELCLRICHLGKSCS